MTAAVTYVDELVKDYLIFRGFTSTLKALEVDLRNDRDRGLRVDRIVDQLTGCISSYDLGLLRETWSHLDKRLFSKCDWNNSTSVTSKLEASLLKMYVVNCISNNKQEKLMEFFEKMTPELQGSSEWKDWFALPFIKSPDEHPTFAMHFSRQWMETMLVSLHNFISVSLHTIPVPTLLAYEEEQSLITTLQEENEMLKQQITALKKSQNINMRSMESTSAGSNDTHLNRPDLMDDFYIIAQEPQVAETQMKSIKSLIKNIGSGLPISPILTRRQGSNATGAKRNSNLNADNSSDVADNLDNVPVTSNSQSTSGQPYAIPVSDAAVTSAASSLSKSVPSKSNKKNRSPSVSCSSSSNATVSSVSINKQLTAVLTTTTTTTIPSKQHQQQTATTSTKTVTSSPKASTVASKEADQSVSETEPKRSSQQEIAVSSSPVIEKTSVPDTADGDVKTDVSELKSPFLLLSQEEFSEHHTVITHCKFNRSGSLIASSDLDGVIKIWCPSPALRTLTTVVSRSSVLSLEWASKDERLLLHGNTSGLLRLYDLKEKRTVSELNTDLQYSLKNHSIQCISCDPLCSSFVASAFNNTSGPSDKSLLLDCDMKTMKSLRIFRMGQAQPATFNCCIYNHNGQLLLGGTSDGRLALFDTRKGDCVSTWSCNDGESQSAVKTVQFSADETSCYSLNSKNQFFKWSINKMGQKLCDYEISSDDADAQLSINSSSGKAFALNTDGNLVLMCGNSGGILRQLGDNSLNTLMNLGGHRTPVVTVDWSSAVDCATCITGSTDGRIRLSTLLAH